MQAVTITINGVWCKRCGLCADVCPKKVLMWEKDCMPVVAHPDNCIRCRLCEMRCPEFALVVEDTK